VLSIVSDIILFFCVVDIFCGTENCYDIVGVERAATAEEIRKAYRKLSVSMHPDKSKEVNATVKFQRLGKAYEVLKGNESRPLFDYYLDHPWDYYKVSGQYFMRNMPKSNVFVVLTVVLLLLSALLWQVQMQNHNEVKNKLRSAVMENLGPKNGGSEYTASLFQVCMDRFQEAYKADQTNKKKGEVKHVGKSKMMADPLFEKVVADVVAEIEIEGGNRKPNFPQDLLIVKVAMLPLTLLGMGGKDKKAEKKD